MKMKMFILHMRAGWRNGPVGLSLQVYEFVRCAGWGHHLTSPPRRCRSQFAASPRLAPRPGQARGGPASLGHSEAKGAGTSVGAVGFGGQGGALLQNA